MSYNREKLYKEVWEKPVSSVAKEYGVSDTAIAKACRRLNVPLPPRGYWAKVQAGQSPSIPELPVYIPEQKKESVFVPRRRETMTVQKKLSYSDLFDQQVRAFLHSCAIDEADLIYHFNFLISCLHSGEYRNYSKQFKAEKEAFINSCIDTIKSLHLPKLTSEWVCYLCDETSAGFDIGLERIKKMKIEDEKIGESEVEEIVNISNFRYDLVSASEYAALLGIEEALVNQWLNSGLLERAIYQNDTWLIPKFHKKPYRGKRSLYLWLEKDKPVHIPEYPLIESCDRLFIIPSGRKYSLEYRNTEEEWEGTLLLSKEERDHLVVELQKQGVFEEDSVFQVPFYPRHKNYPIDTQGWGCCRNIDD